MSVQINSHAYSLRTFLEALHKNRDVLICDSGVNNRIFSRANVIGNEARTFSDEEIQTVLSGYTYFQEYF